MFKLYEGKASKLKDTNSFILFEICIQNSNLGIRIVGNDCTGQFSKEIVKIHDLLDILEKYETIESANFAGLLGGNNNTQGFILAILLEVGFIVPKGNKYQKSENYEESLELFLNNKEGMVK